MQDDKSIQEENIIAFYILSHVVSQCAQTLTRLQIPTAEKTSDRTNYDDALNITRHGRQS